jgi:hypothetical protein
LEVAASARRLSGVGSGEATGMCRRSLAWLIAHVETDALAKQESISFLKKRNKKLLLT